MDERTRLIRRLAGCDTRARQFQNLPHYFPRVTVIVDHHDARTLEGLFRLVDFDTRRVGSANRADRQPNRERGTRLAAVAFGADRPAVELHDVADNREAQTEAAVLVSRSWLPFFEAFEHVREQLGRDADARIKNLQFDGVAVMAKRHVDEATGRCKSDRVR